MTLFLIGDNSIIKFGLDLGAMGLAIKMVLSQIISVSILRMQIKKEFLLSKKRKYEIQIFSVLLIISFCTFYLFKIIFDNENMLFIFGIPSYLILIVCLAKCFPSIFCLSQNWYDEIIQYIYQRK